MDKQKFTEEDQSRPETEPDHRNDTSGGFSRSGHYDLLQDVILRAEVMNDQQTKVLYQQFYCSLPSMHSMRLLNSDAQMRTSAAFRQ